MTAPIPALATIAALALALPSAASATPVTCRSGKTAYAGHGMRFFSVSSGHSKPRVHLYVCTRRAPAPTLLDSGRPEDVRFTPFQPGRHRVGWATVHAHSGTADYDAYEDFQIGWASVGDGRVRFLKHTVYSDEAFVALLDDASGTVVTLAGAAGAPQELSYAPYLPGPGRFAKTEKLLYRQASGAIVPATLGFAAGRISYRTKAGTTRTIDPVTAPAISR